VRTRLGDWTTKLLQDLQLQIHRLQDLAQTLLVCLAKRGALAEVGDVGDIATVLVASEDLDVILQLVHQSYSRTLYFFSTARGHREVQDVLEQRREEGSLREVGHACGVRLAVLDQAEEVYDHLLEHGPVQGLHDDGCLLLARVLPGVYRSGRHVQAFDERRDAVAPVQAEGHPPAQP